ncbi:MAG TPA: M56 family metallopeptidase [Polyangiales bacterium]
MTAALVAFNLLLNAGLSLLTCIGLALGASRLFGIERGRRRGLVLAAPLLKAGWELGRGIPEGAFFWAKLDGAQQELGSFALGLGLELPAIPVIAFSLGALFQGHNYPQSAADVLATMLSRRVAAQAPVLLGALLSAFALVGLSRFALEAVAGVRRRRALLREARCCETRALGLRSVRILVSERWQGVPCAGGLWRPWVCIPAHIERALGPDEREAVIAHELAHLAHHDLLLLSATRLSALLFSFVPGASWLGRQIRAECELAADQRAIRSVPALTLASALVRVAELCQQPREAAGAQLAFLRPGRALRDRVQALLGGLDLAAAGRTPRHPLLRWALAALVIVTILRASIFTNH